MFYLTKKTNFILISLIFYDLSVVDNSFSKCCGNCKKDENVNKNNSNNDINNDTPTINPKPQQKPQQLDNIEELYQYFCDIYLYCKTNETYYKNAEKFYNLDSIKKCAEKWKKNNNIDLLKEDINTIESIKKNIEGNIANEENNKKPDVDPDKDKDKITEIQPIDFSEIPEQDIEEKYNTTGINIKFNDKDKFKFQYSRNSTLYKVNITEDMFIKLDDLIKNFLAKKKLKGNFTIDYKEQENVGVNPIFKIKITNKDSGEQFSAFIKEECIKDYMLIMFKGFQIVGLLPFEYYIDLKNNLIITEDVVEKDFSFLDKKYCPTTDRNKGMWNKCTNMNEFRFWCYILHCDDIDPMYKYDNCCFKDNKVYALDLRCIGIFDDFIKITKEDFFMEYYEDYKGYKDFLRNQIRAINTNTTHGYEDTEQYKIWNGSINSFNDFSDEEKISINDKIINLIYHIVGIFKNNKIKEKPESKKYLSQVCCNIMDFLQFYICKYKKKYTKFEYNGETLQKQYDRAESNREGYSYGKANGIFKKLLDENEIGFKYFLTSDTLVKLYDIYRNKPDDLFYGYIITDVNKHNL